MASVDSKERFSDRVENYVRYRPSYPQEILEPLRQDCSLTPGSIIADVGSGTGILTGLFLQNGNLVHAIEPNGPMREAAERLLAGYPGFRSVSASAEATTLPAASIDFVTAGQAFHWFDPAQARAEFRRILRPGGWALLVWNDRKTTTTPFLQAYEALLHGFANDYAAVNHKEMDRKVLEAFFGEGGFTEWIFPNRQIFDYAGLAGRLLSSSYAPAPGTPGHEPLLHELRKLFDAHQQDGQVAFDYDTLLYYGRLSGS